MKGVPSAPPVRTRLCKPQTNHNTNAPVRASRSASSSSTLLTAGPEQPPVRTSYIELKHHPEARQEIRRQLSNTFPEALPADTGRRTSLASTSSAEPMGVKDRFSRSGSVPVLGQNEFALSSSSTVDSVGTAMRTSMGSESKTIDVEAAINLLQELKKNASPEELVALHRALLPTRDMETVSSPLAADVDRQPFPTQSSTRRSSKILPGLATRGGTDEDVLRKQGENPPRPKRSSQQFDQTPTPAERKDSGRDSHFATLELAHTNPATDVSRAQTPSDEPYSCTGAYKHGSLRITNGAASPEPGRLIKPHLDQAPEDRHADKPDVRTALDFHPPRPEVDYAAAQAVRHRILHSAREQPPQKMWGSYARRNSANTGNSETQAKTAQMLSQPYTPLQLSTSNLQRSPDQDVVSPMSAPPSLPWYQQRLVNRQSAISHASPANNEDAVASEAPPTMLNLASRLSTLSGEDQDGDEETGTPEDALSKLTGETKRRSSSRRRSSPSKPRYYAKAPDDERPAKVQHMDSGYGSDERRLSGIARNSRELSAATETPWTARDSFTSVVRQGTAAQDADGKSMMTVNEFLSSPPTAAQTSPASVSPASKKSRFMSLRSKSSSKRSSAPVAGLYSPQLANDSVQTIDSTQNSPAATAADRGSRHPKKLQKTLPGGTKRQRSLRKAVFNEPASAETPPSVPAHGNSAAAQRPQCERPMPRPEQRTKEELSAAGSQDDLAATHAHKTETAAAPAPTVQHKGPADPIRSMSRGRKAITSAESSTEDLSDHRNFGNIFRKRSKSRSRSKKRMSGSGLMDGDLAAADVTPAASSFGSGPHDHSTHSAHHRPHTANHGVHSPWQIKGGLLKSKSTTGMNEEMASQLARNKSRDITMRHMEPYQERPRMATPKKDKKGKAGAAVSPQSSRSVEDFYPEWHSKAAGTPPTQTAPSRPFSMYAESVPPLPDLPVDAAAKAAKAEVMVAKKLKDGARASPNGSARQSLEPVGSSPIPSKTKTSAEVRREHEQKIEEEKDANDKSLNLLHPAVRPKATDEDVNVEVHEVAGSGSDAESRDSRPTTAAGKDEYTGMPPSPNHDAQHPGWPGWEHQAKLWRDRRVAATLPHDNAPEHDFPAPSRSPAIVVSRYITPLAAENAARAKADADPTSAAAQHADLYRDLIDSRENRPAKPDLPRTDSATSTTTSITVHSRPLPTPPRADSAFSARTWKTSTSTTTTTTTSSAGRHPRHPSPGRSHTPHDATQSSHPDRTRARAFSLAHLTATPSSESLPSVPDPTATLAAKPSRPTLSRPNSGSSAVVDRYSGGLQYEWDRRGGFGGSAGTRAGGESGAARKGQRLAEDWGVDLGDVPVFLRRTEGGMI